MISHNKKNLYGYKNHIVLYDNKLYMDVGIVSRLENLNTCTH